MVRLITVQYNNKTPLLLSHFKSGLKLNFLKQHILADEPTLSVPKLLFRCINLWI